MTRAAHSAAWRAREAPCGRLRGDGIVSGRPADAVTVVQIKQRWYPGAALTGACWQYAMVEQLFDLDASSLIEPLGPLRLQRPAAR